MPYRRLPNTDVARLRAIEAGLDIGKRTAYTKLAFSQQMLENLQVFYPHFFGCYSSIECIEAKSIRSLERVWRDIQKGKTLFVAFSSGSKFCHITWRDEAGSDRVLWFNGKFESDTST